MILDFLHHFFTCFSHRGKAQGLRDHDTGNILEQLCGHIPRGLNGFGWMIDNRNAEAIDQLNQSRQVTLGKEKLAIDIVVYHKIRRRDLRSG